MIQPSDFYWEYGAFAPICTYSGENNWNCVVCAQFHVSQTMACFHIMADTDSHIELMMTLLETYLI
jgi:hypothetical protein